MNVYVVCLVLLLAMTDHSSATYCVCKDGVSDANLQKNIDYACGAGADCSPISQKGACYNPNTLKDHCNYAVNSYFQKKGQATGSCDFLGTATVTPSLSNPSSGCVYPSSPGGTGTPSTTPPTTGTPSTTAPPTTGTPSTTAPPTMGTPSTGTPSTTTPTMGTPTTTIPGSTSPSIFGMSPSGGLNPDNSGTVKYSTNLHHTTTTLFCSFSTLALSLIGHMFF